MNNSEEVHHETRTGIPYTLCMDLIALQIFKTVAEAGGITKAAARLHRVQSNITTRVKQLAASLVALSSEARAALRSGAPRGVLRIGSLESTAATRLPPVLSRYHLAYPE